MNLTEQKVSPEPGILIEMIESFLPRVVIAREGRLRSAVLLAGWLLAVRFGDRESRNPLKLLLNLARRPLLGIGLLAANGYREPQRLPVGNAEDYVYAPTDGRIIALEQVETESVFLGAPAYRLEIASHWLDVPIQRSPMSGQIKYILNTTGLPAKIGLQTEQGLRILLSYRPDHLSYFRLPAPLATSRPVVFRTHAGQQVPVSREIAVRGFGNPLVTTVFLPSEGIDILCRKGQHVQAGMTVLGRLTPR